nr:MAG: sodium:proton exchanger [Vulcanisaeta sp. AZ3]
MFLIILSMLGGLIVTIIGGWLFTNSMENISRRYGLGGSFVGAVVSPIFTSMPELIVFLVAVYLHGGFEGEEVGVGTILGEPYMIATVIYPILFVAVAIGLMLGSRGDAVLEVRRELIIPYVIFTVLYPIVLLPMVLSSHVARIMVAVMLVIAYILYIRSMYRSQGIVIEEVEELYLGRFLKDYVISMTIQLVVSTVLIFIGSKYLVDGVVGTARYLGIDALTISIILIPIATVIPESITALIWTYRGRDTEAVAALIGEKVLYSTVYPALGLILTQWSLNIDAVVSVTVTEVVSLVVLYHVLKGRITWDVGVLGLVGYISYLLISHLI